jgi:hypothetical protein
MKDVGVVESSAFKALSNSIVPNRWQGESNCLVGPFSSRTVAEYFANAVVDFGQYETCSRRIFAKGDSWFVEVMETPVPVTIIQTPQTVL